MFDLFDLSWKTLLDVLLVAVLWLAAMRLLKRLGLPT